MELRGIDVGRCQRPDKEVSEGFCLSCDLLRGLCLETMAPCVALLDQVEPAQGD